MGLLIVLAGEVARMTTLLATSQHISGLSQMLARRCAGEIPAVRVWKPTALDVAKFGRELMEFKQRHQFPDTSAGDL